MTVILTDHYYQQISLNLKKTELRRDSEHWRTRLRGATHIRFVRFHLEAASQVLRSGMKVKSRGACCAVLMVECM